MLGILTTVAGILVAFTPAMAGVLILKREELSNMSFLSCLMIIISITSMASTLLLYYADK